MEWRYVLFTHEDFMKLTGEVKELLSRCTLLHWSYVQANYKGPDLLTPKSYSTTGLDAIRVYQAFENQGLPVTMVK